MVSLKILAKKNHNKQRLYLKLKHYLLVKTFVFLLLKCKSTVSSHLVSNLLLFFSIFLPYKYSKSYVLVCFFLMFAL